MNTQTVMTCYNCGHTGADVKRYYGHVGGKGDFESIQQCENLKECWDRRDYHEEIAALTKAEGGKI